MRSAYNKQWLYHLAVIKEAKRWLKANLITQQQLTTIKENHPVSFYHPNLIVRVLLFVATVLALFGVTGFLALIFLEGTDKDTLAIASFIYGVISFVVLEGAFIRTNSHYKSGVTEAMLYHSIGFVIASVSDFDEQVILWTCLVVFSFSAVRYLDWICTIAAVGSSAGVLFYECYNLGGIFQQIIPFAFIFSFTIVYGLTRQLKSNDRFKLWINNLILVESLSLLLIYAGGNYFVVRELSVEMMGLVIEENQDIPFAFIFYTLTILIPVIYLYFGIKRKDVVLLRVSLIVIAFSAFTFKYYFSLGHPEITLTIAGLILLGVSISLLNYLKVTRYGITRENLLNEKWANANAEAFVISQTMGGNQISTTAGDQSGGGDSGGGGASTSF